MVSKFNIMVVTLTLCMGYYSLKAQMGNQEDAFSGRELPRSEIISYDTEVKALSLGGESHYLESISKKWKRVEGEGFEEYSSSFKRPFLWTNRAVFVRVGSIGASYEILVNDKLVGHNNSSMTAAEFDVTKVAVDGANKISIRIFKGTEVNKLSNFTGKDMLVEGVYISSPPKVYVRDFDINNSVLESGDGVMELGVVLKSSLLNKRMLELSYDVYSPEGEKVADGVNNFTLDMRREDTVRFLVNIPNVKLWNHEMPNLYTIVVRTKFEGRYTEYVNFKSGFRNLQFEKDRFLLNGKELPLYVKEYTATGDVCKTRDELVGIKGQGYNMIKVLSHPQRSFVYGLCDELGLYVCDQADINSNAGGNSRVVGGTLSNSPKLENDFVDRVESMYYRSKGHTSVVMFSIAEGDANGYNLYESYLALKKLEKNRPIIYLGAGDEWNSDAISKGEGRLVFELGKVGAVLDRKVKVEIVDLQNRLFKIKNITDFTTLEVDLNYKVLNLLGLQVVSEGVKPLVIELGETVEIQVPLDDKFCEKNYKLEVSVTREKQKSTSYIYVPVVKDEVKYRFIEEINKLRRENNVAELEVLYSVEL